jgi:hypothetical protein
VVQEATAYQRLLDIGARTDVEEGIGRGLADVARGLTRPARVALDSIRRSNGLSRPWKSIRFAVPLLRMVER